jgi:hypothetical protein
MKNNLIIKVKKKKMKEKRKKVVNDMDFLIVECTGIVVDS